VKRPPYSKLCTDRADRRYSWWVLVGADAWDKGAIWAETPHRIFTLCPPEEDPGIFDWLAYRKAPPPVGLVLCGNVDGNQVQQLVRAMLSAGSPRIYDLLSDVAYSRRKEAA
jgi:hypothetical protein